MNNISHNPTVQEVQSLLTQNDLPTNDLPELDMAHFYTCGATGKSQGVIGLELCGQDGLLRSFAVLPEARGSGCGAALLGKLEQHATKIGIKNLYLLTNTAEKYFHNKGFKSIPRELAPKSIRSTQEFSSLCPASATLMHKQMPETITAN